MNQRLQYCLVLLLLFLGYSGKAQVFTEDTTTRAPFFAAKKFDSKCFVGIEAVPTQILKNKAAMNTGLSLNWVINHRFVVSAKYYVLTTPVNIAGSLEPVRTDTVNLFHQSAALAFGYIFFDKKRFSLHPELTVGWGMAKYTLLAKTSRSDFAVIIPAVYGVYNASRYFRLGLGLNYRATAGVSLNGLKSSDLSGVSGVVFIRVGTF